MRHFCHIIVELPSVFELSGNASAEPFGPSEAASKSRMVWQPNDVAERTFANGVANGYIAQYIQRIALLNPQEH